MDKAFFLYYNGKNKKGGFSMERIYPNYFSRIGQDDAAVEKRIQEAFQTIFFDEEEKFFHEVGEDSGCFEDTGNHDARTEGMSYGMMMCVQMDRQDLFDRFWRFSRERMYVSQGPNAGYFAWSTQLDGTHNAEGPAPDGEEYFAMALLFASHRWGDGEGIFHYGAEARAILRHMVHQTELTGGEPMMHPENHYILFVPGSPFTDPSYHLPHFYELFALEADEADRPFWKEAAAAARRYIALSADPTTGLSPEYAEFDGRLRRRRGAPAPYYSDAYRVVENIALDTVWFGKTPSLCRVTTNIQNFFHDRVDGDHYQCYELDGTAVPVPALHPVAITAVLGAASIASDSPYADDFLRRFWNTPLRKGDRRYYDNCLYFFCLLMLGGRYRIW